MLQEGENTGEVIYVTAESGFETRVSPAPKSKKVPKSDTHPGPGLEYLDGEAGEIRAGEMLGEDD